MGVNKLLKAGIQSEKDKIDEEKKKEEEARKRKKEAESKTDKEIGSPIAVSNSPETTSPVVASTETKHPPIAKHPGGRPPLESQGKSTRKQYSLTLKEEDYKLFTEKAASEDLSFAKFMERAAKEYIRTHLS